MIDEGTRSKELPIAKSIVNGFKKKGVCECIDCPSKNGNSEFNNCCCEMIDESLKTGGCCMIVTND